MEYFEQSEDDGKSEAVFDPTDSQDGPVAGPNIDRPKPFFEPISYDACSSPASVSNQMPVLHYDLRHQTDMMKDMMGFMTKQIVESNTRLVEISLAGQKAVIDLLMQEVGEMRKGQDRLFAAFVSGSGSNKRKRSKSEDVPNQTSKINDPEPKSNNPEPKKRRTQAQKPAGAIKTVANKKQKESSLSAMLYCARVVLAQSMSIGGIIYLVDYSTEDHSAGQMASKLKEYYSVLHLRDSGYSDQNASGFFNMKLFWSFVYNQFRTNDVHYVPAELPAQVTSVYTSHDGSIVPRIVNTDAAEMTTETFLTTDNSLISTLHTLLSKYLIPYMSCNDTTTVPVRLMLKPSYICARRGGYTETTVSSCLSKTNEKFYRYLIDSIIEILETPECLKSITYPMSIVFARPDEQLDISTDRLKEPFFTSDEKNINLGYVVCEKLPLPTSYPLIYYGPINFVSKSIITDARKKHSSFIRDDKHTDSHLTINIKVPNPWIFEKQETKPTLALFFENNVPPFLKQPITCRAKMSYDRMAAEMWVSIMTKVIEFDDYLVSANLVYRLCAVADIWIEHANKIVNHFVEVIMIRDGVLPKSHKPKTKSSQNIADENSKYFKPEHIDCDSDFQALSSFGSMFLPDLETTQPVTAFMSYCNRVISVLTNYSDKLFGDSQDEDDQKLYVITNLETDDMELEQCLFEDTVSFAQLSIYAIYYYYIKFDISGVFTDLKTKLLAVKTKIEDVEMPSVSERVRSAQKCPKTSYGAVDADY